MNRLTIYTFSTLAIIVISACAEPIKSNYKELGWNDLKPYEEKEVGNDASWGALDISEYWGADDYAQGQGLSGIYSGAPRKTHSAGVVPEIDGKNIRVPGFIVPIEFDSGSLATEFFLVPSFGACFHRPPPPPNQTIYVTTAKPIEYESIYDPVWIMGVIKTQQTGNDIATAAYSMDLHYIEAFEE